MKKLSKKVVAVVLAVIAVLSITAVSAFAGLSNKATVAINCEDAKASDAVTGRFGTATAYGTVGDAVSEGGKGCTNQVNFRIERHVLGIWVKDAEVKADYDVSPEVQSFSTDANPTFREWRLKLDPVGLFTKGTAEGTIYAAG